jgi:hypothetical protein
MPSNLTDDQIDKIAEKAAAKMTDAQIEKIAEKAAEKAVAKMTSMVYAEVGRGVINKLLWLVGVVAVAAYAFMQGKGIVK